MGSATRGSPSTYRTTVSGPLCGGRSATRRPALDHAEGRRTAHDDLDKHLGAWCADRSADEILATLWPAGVPVGKAVGGADVDGVEQHAARGYFEPLTHPLTGTNLHPRYPVRFHAGPKRVHRAPSPTLAQRNTEIFGGLLGLDDRELAALEDDGIIGTQLRGTHRTR